MNKPAEKTVKELTAQFQESVEEMKTVLSERDEQIAELGQAREETGAKVTEIGERLETMSEELKSLQEKLSEQMVEGNRPGGALGGGTQAQTIGEAFTSSDAYKEMLESGERKSRQYKFDRFDKMVQKDLSGITSDGGFPVDAQRLLEVRGPNERANRLRELLNVGTTTSNAIEFVQETGFAPLYNELAAAAAADATTIEVKDSKEGEGAFTGVDGFFVGQTIQVGTETVQVDSIDPATNTITITGGGGAGGGLAAAWPVDTGVSSQLFAPTQEKGRKPRANLDFELVSAPVRTIAHWIPATNQIISDAPQLRSYVDGRLIFGLQLTEEEQILYGDGTGQNLQGILTHPSVQSYLWSSGPTGDTKVDAVRRAMTLARLAEFPVTAIVLHPTDWEDIELVKGSDEHYIWMQVQVAGAGTQIWRTPVVDTTAIRPGDFLTGAFGLGAQLWDREQSGVRVADQHADFFIENMLAILAEERIAQTIYRPEAFVAGKFDAPPA